MKKIESSMSPNFPDGLVNDKLQGTHQEEQKHESSPWDCAKSWVQIPLSNLNKENPSNPDSTLSITERIFGNKYNRSLRYSLIVGATAVAGIAAVEIIGLTSNRFKMHAIHLLLPDYSLDKEYENAVRTGTKIVSFISDLSKISRSLV